MGSGSVFEQFVEVIDDVPEYNGAYEHTRSHAEKEVGHPAALTLWTTSRM